MPRKQANPMRLVPIVACDDMIAPAIAIKIAGMTKTRYMMGGTVLSESLVIAKTKLRIHQN
jgi:hypothetical protein